MKDDAPAMSLRVERLRRYGGHAQAWAGLQPGTHHLEVEGGAVVFGRALGTAVILGDPVCDPADRPRVIDAVASTLPAALWFQVGDNVAEHLAARHRLYTTPLGVEPIVDTAAFTLRGRHRQALRSAINHARRTGVEVIEVEPARVPEEPARHWRATRRRRRLSFVVPPLHLPPEGEAGRRAFVARRDGIDLGFVVFDPLHEQGRVVGYTPSVSCGSMRFKPGLWYVLVTQAIERFRTEGIDTVNLGLAPLAPFPVDADDGQRRLSTLMWFGVSVLWRTGLLYNYRGVAHAKSRFGGTPKTMWLAHRHALPLHGLFALWRLVARA